MNDFGYLRTIISSDSSEVLQHAFKSLSNEGLEVYVQDLKNRFYLANENLVHKSSVLLVPAADWDFAVEILTSVGLEKYLTECIIPEGAKSELDIAVEKYYKKRKWTYIEAGVIIVVALLYFLIKIFTN
ncbi:hypothetical protein SAMN05421493_101475 [Pseudobutyrivibrio sp. 49]|uniref:hypothetical protein n=1 Tax=unclassified Pseudobutyrivibrio TaxID=2638619 RepID=UPI00087FF3AD|nr:MULTISPECIES: hypothetical protein [unclassified Pseudobutyrivibrio]SDH40203.1 hypothetical protein SAMN05421493_101475 [Pseudobutyrivibrio sp. 49]SFN45948.1 hypothetical protein SAMN04487831_101256 [Pseudobutyrivibrio sp. UC1225]